MPLSFWHKLPRLPAAAAVKEVGKDDRALALISVVVGELVAFVLGLPRSALVVLC